MIKLQHIISESFINAFTPEEKEKYGKEVWDILQKSYASIGGFHSANNIEELIRDSYLWKMNRKNGKIVAVRIYKDKHGRKSIAAGTDGSEEGKKALFMTMRDDVKLGRSWGEVSGKMEGILIKKFNAQPVPNKYAEKILGKKIMKLNPDGYHYTRLIGGHPHEKVILVGNDVGKFIDKVNDKLEERRKMK